MRSTSSDSTSLEALTVAGDAGLDCDRFIDDNNDRLRRYARHLCKGTLLDHDDVHSEAMAKLVENWSDYSVKTEEQGRREARRALVNAKSTLGRKARRNAQREPPMGSAADLHAFERLEHSVRDPFHEIGCDPLPDLLNLLPDEQRDVFLIKTLDPSVSFVEVGELLNMNYDQVRGKFYRARSRLEQALKADGRRSR